jgi:hypothetical protein
MAVVGAMPWALRGGGEEEGQHLEFRTPLCAPLALSRVARAPLGGQLVLLPGQPAATLCMGRGQGAPLPYTVLLQRLWMTERGFKLALSRAPPPPSAPAG